MMLVTKKVVHTSSSVILDPEQIEEILKDWFFKEFNVKPENFNIEWRTSREGRGAVLSVSTFQEVK